jgi:hypothetical protein
LKGPVALGEALIDSLGGLRITVQNGSLLEFRTEMKLAFRPSQSRFMPGDDSLCTKNCGQ